MIKAILFDADGMLINTESFSVQYSRDFKVSQEKILPFFQNEFQLCLIGEADLKKVIKPYLALWQWNKSVDDFLQYWFKSEHRIDDRIVNVIHELRQKDIRCYLATNQEKYRTQYMRDEMGFAHVFDGIFSSAEAGSKKPSTEFFDYVFEMLPGLNKKDIVFWDDKEENVIAARDYGFQAEQYTSFEDFRGKIAELTDFSTNFYIVR